MNLIFILLKNAHETTRKKLVSQDEFIQISKLNHQKFNLSQGSLMCYKP